MKFAAKIALCLIAGLFIAASACPAFAAPADLPCLAKQFGSTGTDYKTGRVGGVNWLGWVCTVKGNPVVYGFVWDDTYEIKHPNTAGMTTNQTVRAYWNANVDPLLAGAKYEAARKEMRAAFGQP